MIQDICNLPSAERLEADICIVGAGAAGISIAHTLLGSGLSVLLVESGGFTFEEPTQALYRGESTGHPVIMDEGRYRLLGGSTSRWTGRCGRLDPIDYEERDWVPGSGWPIGPRDLDAAYAAAARLCGFKQPWLADAAASEAIGAPIAATSLDAVKPFVWRYAPQGNREYIRFGQEYRSALQQDGNTRVLLHVNFAGFDTTGAGDRVHAIHVTSLQGRRARIAAKHFVLACGGIENARILLHSGETPAAALGNAHDQVGRRFMQHPRGRVATVRTSPAGSARLQDSFNIFATRSGVQHEIGFALSSADQRQHRLLNASAILTYNADPRSSWEAAKTAGDSLRRRKLDLANTARALRDPAAIVRNAWRKAVQGRHVVLDTASIDVTIDLEQAPDPDSRVTLSDERDALGQRRAKVDWRLSGLERTTARHLTMRLAEDFRRLGLGEVTPEPWLDETGPIPNEALSGTYHHLCTTRMSHDPANGVVDADCRVHGVENLYVAGCSVFATGGQVNPTLTIVALAVRLARHLQVRVATVARVRAAPAGVC